LDEPVSLFSAEPLDRSGHSLTHVEFLSFRFCANACMAFSGIIRNDLFDRDTPGLTRSGTSVWLLARGGQGTSGGAFF
jgi:hypothetical protein